MQKTSGWKIAIANALLSSTALAAPAFGQTGPTPPPVFSNVDAHGYDLTTGRLVINLMSIDIGPGGPGSLGFNWSWTDAGQRPEVFGYVIPACCSGSKATVVLGGESRTFTASGSPPAATYTQDQGDGSTLTYDAGSASYIYVMRDGARATFRQDGTTTTSRIQSLVYPQGQTLRYYYTATSDTYPTAVTSSLGYQLRLERSGGTLTKTVVFNMANESCAPTAATCVLSGSWPTVTRNIAASTLTDSTGRTVSYISGSGTMDIVYPSGRRDSYTGSPASGQPGIAGFTPFSVQSYSDGKGNWRYSRFGNNYTYQGAVLVYNPGAPNPETYNISASGQLVDHTKDSKTQLREALQYDNKFRVISKSLIGATLTSVTTYAYDDRGNIIEERRKSTSAGSPADIVTSAAYLPTCDSSNQAYCNKPQYTTDPRQNVTNYSYFSFGDLQQVMMPAGSNGVRPTTTYSYAQNVASFNGSQGDPVWVLTGSSTCVTQASCAGSADESKTTIVHDASNALLPITVTQGGGDGSLTATVTSSYYPTGDVKAVDGAMPGSGDTVRHYYDAMRRETGMIGPDPDDGGPRLRMAQRTNYAPDGQVGGVEQGTATGQGDGDMATFSALQSVATTFDAQGRPSATRLNVGGVTRALTEYSYTAAGLPLCSAIRMNVAALGATTDACSLTGQGPDGPDRISQVAYDLLDRPVTTTVALGTAAQAVEKTTAYDDLGRIASVKDANANQTSYGYDGMSRLQRTTLPDGSFETLSYDAASNVLSRRLRDGQTLGYTYDALNRRIYDDNPNTNVAEVDVSYAYDNLGRLTRAQDQNGWFKSFSYDTLGRVFNEASIISSTGLNYDAAGKLLRQTWSDGFFVTFDYDNAGELSSVRENGGFVLASFDYDDLGRRKTLARGNGVTTSYSYDAAGRLGNLSFGGSSPNSYGFSYNAAGQITSRSSQNDAYAWNGSYNTDRTYATNTLNQYTSAGSTTFGYDGRGNLINSGGTTYQYNTRNQLFMNGAGQLFYRGPTGQLGQTPGINYDWVRGQIAQESSGGVLRRYVYGPDVDEPLVWYEGAGTGDRRWMIADERGSIVAVTDGGGNASTINTYDEFGIPGPNNAGRFQYTGQAWISELGMYDYKARMYSPTLGRFMQTDPIGYDDGMNWYNYVKSDPINAKDPSGLDCLGLQKGPCLTPPPQSSGQDIVVNGFVRPFQFVDNPLYGRSPLGSLLPLISFNDSSGFAKPQKVNPDRRPSYCGSTLFQLGKMANDLGEFGDKVSTAFVVAGVVSGGTGLVPALGFKAAAGAAQVGGAALQALAGDPTAGRRAIAGAIGTFLPTGLVPKSLRNDLADLVADKAFGSAMDKISSESQCSRFAN